MRWSQGSNAIARNGSVLTPDRFLASGEYPGRLQMFFEGRRGEFPRLLR